MGLRRMSALGKADQMGCAEQSSVALADGIGSSFSKRGSTGLGAVILAMPR